MTKFRVYSSLLSFVILILCFGFKAEASSSEIGGKSYHFGKETAFVFDQRTDEDSANTITAIGSFSLSGTLKSDGSIGNVHRYDVTGNQIYLSYQLNMAIYGRTEDQWNLYECDDETVNEIKLGNDVDYGAIIVQSSMNGHKWVTEKVILNAFKNGEDYNSSIFATSATNDIQIANGCYYRVIIAYMERRKVSDSWINPYEYRKTAEVYEVYLFDSEKQNDTTRLENAVNKRKLGTLSKAITDNGYSGQEEIRSDDSHYNWEIGSFYVCGYTDEEGTMDEPVFLKNAGDRVTLWFRLEQNIDCLNNNPNLKINYNEKTYDQEMHTPVQDFKHGALVIQYTNKQNETSDPIVYTDYLASCAINGQNTKVELFEEGDYVVALDYEIKKEGAISRRSNYRVAFRFKIRNGNAMAFFKDLGTQEELVHQSITPNGFKVDYAKSQYINVYVEHKQINNRDLDTRGNKPAKDGEEFNKEGVYFITIFNEYTKKETPKIIYVGTNPIYKAAVRTGLSIPDIYKQLDAGYTITEDGTLMQPQEPETDSPTFPVEYDDEKEKIDAVTAESQQPIVEKEVDEQHTSFITYLIVGVVVVVIFGGCVLFVMKNKKRNTANETHKEDSNEKI